MTAARFARRAAALAALGLAVGCATTATSGGWAKGGLRVQGGELGSREVTFASCRSGVRRLFFGADLTGDGVTMRVLRSPTNQPVLVLGLASGVAIELSAASCTKLDVDVFRGMDFAHRDDFPYSDWVSGSADVACSTPAGGHVEGHITFSCD